MSLGSHLYERAPRGVQNVAVSLSGYRRNLSRFGTEYWLERERLVRFDRFTFEDKIAEQERRTAEFLQFAMLNSPFYHERLRNSIVDGKPSLERTPALLKDDLRRSVEQIYTVSRRNAVEGHTGGTTGKSLVVRFTRSDFMRRMAAIDHFKAKHGFENRQMRRATFNGQHIVGTDARSHFWRFNRPTNQLIFSSFHIQESNVPAYLEALNDFSPASIDGFFSSMVDIASYMLRHGIRLQFAPIAVFPTSETVTPEGREIIESAFGAPVFDQYSSSEGAPFITECNAGSMHIDMSSGVFEYGGDEGVSLTSFSTHGTPLIRYMIGDVIEPSDNVDCTCGVQSLTVDRIGGRTDEFLVRSDGARVTAGNVANIFKNLPNALVGAQLIQERVGSVTILLQWDFNLFEPWMEGRVRSEFEHKFDKQTVLTLRRVDDLPRADSGKQRFIINTIPD